MFSLFLRGMILYIVMIVAMRMLGKRQLGQFEPYEFAMAILLADVISAPMGSVSTPLLHGLLPVGAMMVVHCVITLCSMRSDRLRAIISGKPALIISRGVIDQKMLNRLCLNPSDLLEGLRSAGFLDPSEVGTAVIEANGTLSAFAHAQARPPRSAELDLQPGYEGLPLILVMDGRIQRGNLSRSGKDAQWLDSLLSSRGLEPREIYLASLNTQGVMMLQTRTGAVELFEALKEKEVSW